jgi:TonB family protein
VNAVAAALLLIVLASPGALLAQAPDKEWTDAYPPGNGVTLPKLVQEVKPRYTADAMRARVQGTVWVDCVVEIDGTVRRTRVNRSLDRQFGLDEEAVAAARQWRFVAGTKDGTPVPVVVTIELKFSLRDPEPAALSLPAAFSAGGGLSTPDITWETDVVEIPTLTVSVSRPKEWMKTTGGPNTLLALMANDMSGGVYIATPAPSKLRDLPPTSLDILQEMGKLASNAYKRRLIAVGQARIANRLWLWNELGPLETAGDNLWLFTTITEGHEVAVGFTSAAPGSAGVFSLILERLVFTRRR